MLYEVITDADKLLSVALEIIGEHSAVAGL